MSFSLPLQSKITGFHIHGIFFLIGQAGNKRALQKEGSNLLWMKFRFDLLSAAFFILLLCGFNNIIFLAKFYIVAVMLIACFLFRVILLGSFFNQYSLSLGRVNGHLILQLLQLQSHAMQSFPLLGIGAKGHFCQIIIGLF